MELLGIAILIVSIFAMIRFLPKGSGNESALSQETAAAQAGAGDIQEVEAVADGSGPSSDLVAKLLPHYRIPSPPKKFLGRKTELGQLAMKLNQNGIILSDVKGLPGIGKSALAFKLASEISPNFPDGGIYINLKGQTSLPMTATDAMTAIIRVFFPRMELPENIRQLQDLYMRVLSGKAVLLVLDDASKKEQVAQLIPDKPGFAIVTTRKEFEVEGCTRELITPLEFRSALKLLKGATSNVGILADELVKLCENVPLALKMIGGALDAIKDLDVMTLISKVQTKKKIMDQMSGWGENRTVEAIFKAIYQLMSGSTSEVGRKLAMFQGTFTATAEEYICQDKGNTQLRKLMGMGCVDFDPVVGRYWVPAALRQHFLGYLTQVELTTVQNRRVAYYLEVLQNANRLYSSADSQKRQMGIQLFDLEWGGSAVDIQLDFGSCGAQSGSGEALLFIFKRVGSLQEFPPAAGQEDQMVRNGHRSGAYAQGCAAGDDAPDQYRADLSGASEHPFGDRPVQERQGHRGGYGRPGSPGQGDQLVGHLLHEAGKIY